MYHQPTVRVLFVSAGGPELLRPLDTLAGAFAELGHAVEFAGPPDTPTDAGAGSWTAVGWPAEQARQQYLRNHPDLASLDRNERGAFSMAHLFGGVMAPASAADLIRLVADGGFELVAHDPCALAAPLAARLAGVRSVCCGPVLPTEWTAAASDAVAPLWRTWGLEPEPHAGLYAHPYVDIRPRLLRNGVEAPGVTIPMRCTPEPERRAPAPEDGRTPPTVLVDLGLTSTDLTPMVARTVGALHAGGYGIRLSTTTLERTSLASRQEDGTEMTAVQEAPDVVVTHGDPVPVLRALSSGVPLVLLPCSPFQQLLSDAVAAAGACTILDATGPDPGALVEAIRLRSGDSGRRSAAAVAASIAEQHAPETVARMIAHGESVGTLPAAVRSGSLTVTAAGHATTLVDTERRRIIIDPVFAPVIGSGTVEFRPRRTFAHGELAEITHIVLTHQHLDHFHPDSLTSLPRSATVLAPHDDYLLTTVHRLGFTDVHPLAPWDRWKDDDVEITATPSDAELDEFGVAIRSGNGSYWHVSDSLVRPGVGARLRDELGPMGCVAAHFQPGTALWSTQRGLGVSHDERASVVDWLEAACATDPGFVFPSFWGLAYCAEAAWANRYVAPLRDDRIARLLERRLGHGRAGVLRPGDSVHIDGRQVDVRRASSPVVVDGGGNGSSEEFEPVDTSTLPGVDEGEIAELATLLDTFLTTRFSAYVSSMDLTPWKQWGVVWQATVHVGGGRRFTYSIDFRPAELVLRPTPHPDASFVVHLSGQALLAVLRGDAGSELFWLSGAVRMFETVLTADEQGFRIPPWTGWELFEHLPEPMTMCLRSAS